MVKFTKEELAAIKAIPGDLATGISGNSLYVKVLHLIAQHEELGEDLEDIYLLVEGKTVTKNAPTIEDICLRAFKRK